MFQRGKLPAFLLNPLVENAVKHGFRTSAKPLKIRIFAELLRGGGLFLEVAKTGRLQNISDANGTRAGLETCANGWIEFLAGAANSSGGRTAIS